MKNRGRQLAAGTLAAMLTFSVISIEVSAAGSVSSVLPTGGASLSLVNNTTLADVQTESVTASGKIEASVTLADVPELATATAALAVQSEEELFQNLVIAQVSKYVNVRSMPSEEGEIVGKLYNESVGSFLSEENGWYQIQSGSVTGYVKAEYCVTGEDAIELAKKVGTRLATVTTTTLFVRSEPTTESSVISMIPEGEDYIVIEETDTWARITLEDGEGWVSKDYVEIHSEFVEAESKAEEEARLAKEAEERKKAQEAARARRAAEQQETAAQQTTTPTSSAATYTVVEGSELGVAVAEYALQFVGNPYKWGGTSLTNGADCSGFVMSVYANFGVSLPHSSKSDRTQGSAVDGLENAQPGDLICYSGHVALYIGNGQIVHASNKRTGIIVSNADYKKILAIRRIF